MASLRREYNNVFPQCFHTGHSSKLDLQWVYTSTQKERIIYKRNDGLNSLIVNIKLIYNISDSF